MFRCRCGILGFAVVLFVAVFLGGVIPKAHAAVTLLNGPNIQTGYSSEESTNNDPSFSYSVSIPAGTQLAVVGVTNRTHRKATATLGGAAMTDVVDREGDDQRAQILVRINPPTGTQTIAFTFSGDTKAETSGVYCFSGVDTDDFAALNAGFPLALGNYASTDPSVTFSSPAPPAGSVIVSLASTKYEMSTAAMTGDGTKTVGYRRWPEWKGVLGIGNEMNGGAMGIATGFSGATASAGWDLTGSGTIAAVVIRQASLAPANITPGSLTVNDDAANDSVVGTLTVTDADGEAPYTWTLLDDAGGRFKLSATSTTVPTVNLLVANTALIDRALAASHSISVRVGDKATYNADYTKTLTIQVADTTRPVISNLTAVPTYAKAGDAVQLTVTATDNVALSANPAMTINGVDLGAPSSVSGSTFTFAYVVPSVVTQGPAAINVSATDTSANTTVAPFNSALVLDTNAPQITGLNATPPFTLPGRNITLRVTVSDPYGLQGIPAMSANGADLGAPTAVSGDEYTFSYALPAGAPDGPVAINVTATDRAGNIGTQTSSSILIVDSTAPAISGIATDDSPARANTIVLVRATVSDANGLVTTPRMLIGGLDAGAPIGISDDTYTYQFAVPLSMPEGYVSIVVSATDKAGNAASLPENSVLFIDNTPPAIQGLSANPAVVSPGHSAAIQMRIQDLSSIPIPPAVTVNGVNAGQPTSIVGNVYTYSYVVGTNVVEGPATIRIQVSDAAGNESISTASNLLTLDASGPQITNITATPSPAKAGDAVALTCTVADTYSPLSGIPTLSVNGVSAGAPTNVSGNVYSYAYTVASNAANGWATVRIQAADTVGNTNVVASSSVLQIDTVPPVITNIQANPNVVKDGDEARITFAATDVTTSLRTNPTVTVNGHPATFYSRAGAAFEYRYTIDGTVDTDGYLPIVVTAVDQVYNTATLSALQTLLIDSSVPTISALSAYPRYAGDGTPVTIVFSVNEDNGLPDHPAVTVNGHEARFASNDGDSYEYTYIVGKDTDVDGPAEVRVVAVDVLGNIGQTQNSGLLTIDMTPPTGTLRINGDALFTRVTDVSLSLAASDGPLGTGVDVVRYSDDGLNWTPWEKTAASRAWALPAGQGYRTVYAELRDRTGNISAEPLMDRIALNPKPLTVTVDGGTEHYATLGSDVTLEVTVSGSFGAVSYNWTRADQGGVSVGQSPVLVIHAAQQQDAGTYICTVTDELDAANSPDVHVAITESVPSASLPARLLLAAMLVALGVWTLLRRGGASAVSRAALVLFVVSMLVLGGTAFAQTATSGATASKTEYTIIYSARTVAPDVSDEALAALALEQGSIEVVQKTEGEEPKRCVSRWGEPGVGMPGFTSRVRETAQKLKASGVKVEMQKDGRESCTEEVEDRCRIVYRFPKGVGAQEFEAALYDLAGQRQMTERRTETVVNGEVRPLTVRVDFKTGSFMQIFAYSGTPEFPTKAREAAAAADKARADASAAKAVRYDTVSKQDLLALMNAQKSDDSITRMVQFIVPPQGMDNLGFDSGWVPGGGTGNPGGFIVQARLNIGAGFNYDATVSGNFTLHDSSILTAGAASGHWGFYFGAHFFLKLAFDIPIPGFSPFTVNIPYVPDFNMVASDRDDFNSFLLDETSTLHNESLRQKVVDLNIISLLITQGVISLPSWLPLPGIGVRLDVAPIADGHLTCTSIDLSDGNRFTTEGQSVSLTIPPEGYRATVVYNSSGQLDVGAKTYPTVFIGIGSLWEYSWPPADDTQNILNQLQWLPIHLTSFPFSDSELNFTGQPSTGDPTDWFTQYFNLGDNDVKFKRVLFTPNYSNNFYVACIDDADDYRTSPYDGTPLELGDNDFVEVALKDGKQVQLYGQKYSSFFVGSNGYITFTQGDTESNPNLDNHFDLPRISGMFTDMKPNESGQVFCKQYTNRVVVTYDKVFLSNVITENTVSCQIEMFFDGRIVITWLDLDLYGGLIGLSRGGGTPANYTKSRFTRYPSCVNAIPDEGAVTVRFQPAAVQATTARWRLDDGEWHASGETEAAAVGVHTLNFNAVDGWAPPPARQLVFTKDYLMETTEIWTRQTGTVQVLTSPAYAQWSFVDGDGLTHTGAGSTFVYGIPTGVITITWPPLATFEQPAPPTQGLVLYPNSTVVFTGRYAPIIGMGRATLRVTLEPKAARTGGAQWRFNGGAWQNSGDEIQVPDGEATISFKSVYGWDAPDDKTLFIDRDTEYDLPFEYVRQRGSIIINVDPEGAPWAVIDGDGIPHTGWGDSHLDNLPAGPIQVVWGFVNTYTEPYPNPFTAELFSGDTLTVIGSYVPVLGQGEGLLSVQIAPAAARAAGAQWRVTGGEWHDSGANVALPDGRHTVKFKPLTGWIAPLDADYMVERNHTSTYTADYIRQTGSVGVAVSPQTASWSMTDSDGGVYEGVGNRTLTGVPSGLLTLTWQPLNGYRTPDPAIETRTLEPGGDVRFVTTYSSAEMVVDFEAYPVSGVVPLTVQFNNKTTSPGPQEIQYRWLFGDGDSSTEANPVHTYTAEGPYTVSLVATDLSVVKMETKKHFILVQAGLPAAGIAGTVALALVMALLGAGLLLRGRRRGIAGALLLLAFVVSAEARAADYWQAHDNLTLDVGFPDWGFDTGWVGVDTSTVQAQVELKGGISGTVLGMDLAGQGWLTCPSGPDQGVLRFVGGPSTIEQSLGVTLSGQYRIIVPSLGINTTQNINILAPTGLFDSKLFTAYNLGETITLADRLDNFKIADIPIKIGTAVTGTLGVKLSIGDRIDVQFKRLDTSVGAFTTNGEEKTLATPDAELAVNGISLAFHLAPDVNIYIIVDVNLNIAGLTSINTSVNVPEIPVPLETLLEDEYSTTPARNITFGIAPTLQAFSLNNGANGSILRTVNLNMACYNKPSEILVSEDPAFAGATWTPFTGVPQFQLSESDGFKTVYVKVRNAHGESVTRSDSITLYSGVPTVNALGTNDTTPALSGHVNDPNATVTLTVAGQTLSAQNLGSRRWALPDNALAPLADGVYDVAVTETDEIGNVLHDTTVNELIVDTVSPSVTIEPRITNDSMPELNGTISDPQAEVWISVWVYYTLAHNNGDGTWTLPQGTILLLPGEYDVRVIAVDPANNTAEDATHNELLIDVVDPVVTVNALVTGDNAPPLSGTISELDAVVEVEVNHQTYSAVNVGDGTWRIADNVLEPLAEGVYDVRVTATDPAGNVGTDKTTDELHIDFSALTVIVDPLVTHDSTPPITGLINRETATITVTIDGNTYDAVNRGDGTWMIADNTVAPLSDGTYDVQAHAVAPGLGQTDDAGFGELSIDTVPPSVSIALLDPVTSEAEQFRFSVTFSEPVSPTFGLPDIRPAGSVAQILLISITGTDPAYGVTITKADPLENGTLGIRIPDGAVTDPAGNPCAGVTSSLYNVVNWPGLAVELQDTMRYKGDDYTFVATLAVSGLPAQYQWKWEDGAKRLHDGPAAETWALTGLSDANIGDYWCEIAYCGKTHTSATARLSVEEHLQITVPPVGGQSPAGTSYVFTVQASGGYAPLSYVWTKDGNAIPGATEASYTRSNLTDSDAGVYAVAVSDANTDVRTASAELVIGQGMPLAGPVGLVAALILAALRAGKAARKK